MDIRSLVPRSLGDLRRKAPQLVVAGVFALVFLAVMAMTLEDVLIDGEPLSGTVLFRFFHATFLFTQGFTAAIASLGYAGVFCLMLLESTSLPVPSEVILPFAGYLVFTGQLNLWLTITVSTLAGLIGCLIDYYIGMKGLNLLSRQRIMSRVLKGAYVQRTEKWFNKYGATAVFLSRLAPVFRTLISFPAGAVKMPLSKFVVYTAAGCLLWNTILICGGVVLGTSWQRMAAISNYLIVVAVAVISVAVAALFVKRKKTMAIAENGKKHA